MNAQVRDVVVGMRKADAVPCECGICGRELDSGSTYSPFATVCRDCADAVEAEEAEWHDTAE